MTRLLSLPRTVSLPLRCALGLGFALASLSVVSLSAAATEPLAACQGAKLRAAGKFAKSVAACAGRAIKQGEGLDAGLIESSVATCGGPALTKLQNAWAAAESAAERKDDEQCQTGANPSDVAQEIDEALVDLAKSSFESLPTGVGSAQVGIEQGLLASLLGATSNFQTGLLGAEAKNLTSPDEPALDAARTSKRLQFEKAWNKADATAAKKGIEFAMTPPSDRIVGEVGDLVDLIAVSAAESLALVVSSNNGADVAASVSDLPVSGSVLVLNGSKTYSVVKWHVANGTVKTGEFAIDAAGNWAGTVPLSSGDNTVTLSLPEAAGAKRSFVATYNPGYNFAGKLDLTPDISYVATPRTIVARIALNDPGTNPAAVQLVAVDGSQETPVATFTDDGDLDNGDDIEGDLVYSTAFDVLAAAEGTRIYRVVVGKSGGGQARSERSRLLVSTPISDAEWSNLLNRQQSLETRIIAADESGHLDTEIGAVVAELRADPGIADAGATQSQRGAWFVTQSGVGGLVYAPGSDIKGGGDRGLVRASSSDVNGGESTAEVPPLYDSYRATAPSSSPQLQSALATTPAAVDSSNSVASNKAYVLAAQYFDWGQNDDIPLMKDILENQSCFDVNYKAYTAQGAGSVEDFKNLGDYGIILISSHGDSFYNGLLSLWQDRFQWNGPFGQVVLHSNMAVTPTNQLKYQDDLKAGRLVLWNGHYGILPSFIRRYAGQLPNSLVYMSICRGTWNSTLAQAFLDQGAGAFLGYDDYVSVKFTMETGPPLLTTLLQPGKTLADAFIPGKVDPYSSDHAEFKRYGTSDLSLGDQQGLVNGSFEDVSLTQAWSVDGDARRILALGADLPTNGSAMAVISTGLGFTTATGTLSQEICLPPSSASISFDWNFYSEEFLEWVGSIYQDSFTVSMTDTSNPASTTILLHNTIDSLASSVSPVSISFDRGGVYATGWRSQSAAIPQALRGKRVTLRFFATDVGDSIYDTAVLIDDVALSP